jgi:hypothetical protein
MCERVASDGIQTHDGYGYSEDIMFQASAKSQGRCPLPRSNDARPEVEPKDAGGRVYAMAAMGAALDGYTSGAGVAERLCFNA